MPRKKKSAMHKEFAEPKKVIEPKVIDGMLYSVLIALLVVLISGAYYKSSPCTDSCQGENIANGYPYQWFVYNTYAGWERGSISWLGGILDLAFWAFLAYVVMLVFYAATKEVQPDNQ